MLVPKSFELLPERRIASRHGRFDTLFFWPQPDFLLRRRGREMRAALAAHRALGGGVLRLLEATVWTFHTDFCRRRLCGHWRLWRRVIALDSSPESWFRSLRRMPQSSRVPPSKNAKASVEKKTVIKILNMPFCAYFVQISTTFLLSSTEALSTPSSRMFFLMNSTAR